MHELIAEQEQPFALDRFYPAFHLIGRTVAEEAGDVAPRSGGFFRAHKQLKNVFADHFVFAQPGVLLAQPVEALDAAVLIDDHDHRVGFGHHLLGEGEAVHQIARHG